MRVLGQPASDFDPNTQRDFAGAVARALQSLSGQRLNIAASQVWVLRVRTAHSASADTATSDDDTSLRSAVSTELLLEARLANARSALLALQLFKSKSFARLLGSQLATVRSLAWHGFSDFSVTHVAATAQRVAPVSSAPGARRERAADVSLAAAVAAPPKAEIGIPAAAERLGTHAFALAARDHWAFAMVLLVMVAGLTLVSSTCLLYTSPSPRDQRGSRMPSSA